MRSLIVKYQGECARCGNTLEVGETADYEKPTGIFCPGHFPTDPEEIRAFRVKKAEAKAARYDAWADKREARANAQLNSNPEIRHDIAFITQPGRIPMRERMNKSDERAYESLNKADRMREKAASIRNVRVKGDAARRDEAKRAAVDEWIKPGMDVQSPHYGGTIVLKVNKKSVRVHGKFGEFLLDKMFFSKVRQLRN